MAERRGSTLPLSSPQARRSVLVLETGENRNRFDQHLHGYLASDGLDPAVLLARGREEVERFGGVLQRARAVDARVTAAGRGFEVDLDDGSTVTT